MITRKTIGIPHTIIVYMLLSISLLSCEPDDSKKNIAYKPNIYIYPEKETQIDVMLSFPMGGNIITSIPEYVNGWSVTVDENGIINDLYSYLFYESIQPDIWQKSDGWLIEKNELDSFFRMNMLEFGFYGQEIDDFIDYWIPRLNDHPFYAIYPQPIEIINEVIRIDFSIQPDNQLRLFYAIAGHDRMINNLQEPEIDSYIRDGYFVTEWGVIL